MRPARPPPKQAREAGFTLLELLVAMTLLGLLGLAMYGGIRFSTRAWEAVSSRSEGSAEVNAVQAFLRREIARIYPLKGLRVTEPDEIAFEGTETSLRFIAPLPTFLGIGGYYFHALEFETIGSDERLLFRQEIYEPGDEGFEFPDEDLTRSLLMGVREANFSYFGVWRKDDPPEWRSHWRENDRLPILIRLEVNFKKGDQRSWPVFIAPLRVRTLSKCAISPRSAKCRENS